jgi:hypothetical protein
MAQRIVAPADKAGDPAAGPVAIGGGEYRVKKRLVPRRRLLRQQISSLLEQWAGRLSTVRSTRRGAGNRQGP